MRSDLIIGEHVTQFIFAKAFYGVDFHYAHEPKTYYHEELKEEVDITQKHNYPFNYNRKRETYFRQGEWCIRDDSITSEDLKERESTNNSSS